MTYRLSKLAAGSYDVILNGVIVAGIVRSTMSDRVKWTAELLLVSRPRTCHRRSPRPARLKDLSRWLLSLAFCLCFAALGPVDHLARSLAGLLLIAALASLGRALARREHPQPAPDFLGRSSDFRHPQAAAPH